MAAKNAGSRKFPVKKSEVIVSQLLTLWDSMEPRKRVIAVLASIALIAAVIGLMRAVNQPSYALLYAGLDPSTSGEIVTALEGQGVGFEVRGNAIYVDSGQRDQVRMSLASQGLPANGIAGYELLDGLSGFSTTSQMFDAAYWRAKEGELARTILATPDVRSARVHIANPVNRPFDRTTRPSASVILTMGTGSLSATQAKAMRFLVASAVAGLEPDDVSVIDSANGVVLAAGAEPEVTPGDDINQRAAAYRSNIERLLAARVGPGNAIVEVNIDANMDTETITERVLDPDSRVSISSEAEETTSSSAGSGPGAVTVASNLPDGDVQGGSNESQSSNSSTTQRNNYEYSEVRRERVKGPGEIRKVTVAVLVNGTETEDGSSFEPRPQEELEQLRDLVKSAIGFDEARGDVVTIESMAFVPATEAGSLATSGAIDFFAANAMKLIQLVVFAAVALALGLGVLKPVLTPPAPPEEDEPIEGTAEVLEEGDPLPINEAGEIELNPEVLALAEQRSESIDELKNVITEHVEESKMILQKWLDTPQPQQEQV